MIVSQPIFFFFFFNDTATTEIYTLSLHDALPICNLDCTWFRYSSTRERAQYGSVPSSNSTDRKSTRLNSSHLVISYAVFCLKKKKKKETHRTSHSPMRSITRYHGRVDSHVTLTRV